MPATLTGTIYDSTGAAYSGLVKITPSSTPFVASAIIYTSRIVQFVTESTGEIPYDAVDTSNNITLVRGDYTALLSNGEEFEFSIAVDTGTVNVSDVITTEATFPELTTPAYCPNSIVATGGTQPRSVRDRFGDILTVNDFATVQAALTAAAGGRLYFPEGDYEVSATLTVPSNIRIFGEGKIVATASMQSVLSLSSVENVTIEGIEIDGDANALVGIYVYDSDSARIEQTTIRNCTRARGASALYASGILVRESDYIVIDRNRFYANGRSDEISGSIYFFDSLIDSKYCVISNNYIKNAGFHGINIYDTSYCKVVNNYIDQGNIGTNAGNNGYGILCYDGTHHLPSRNHCIGNVISGNTVENSYGIGIYLVVCKDCVVSNNILKNVCLQQDSAVLFNAGININEGIRIIVEGNTIDGVGGAQANWIAGIGVLAGQHVTVSGNHVNDVTTGTVYSYGIFLGGQGEVFTDSGLGVKIISNTVQNCDSDGIHCEGNIKTECEVSNNFVTTVSRHGIYATFFQRGLITNNIVKNWGGGLSGIVLVNIGGNSQRNLVEGNQALAITGSGYGSSRCFYLDTPGPNWVQNNVAFSSPTMGIGFYDPHATGGNIYEGNQTTGTITTPYNITAAGCSSFIGSGTPESVIGASIGSTFRRTNGGAGTSFYVKESGTGNTGWAAK